MQSRGSRLLDASYVGKSHRIFRGRQPNKSVKEIADLKITDVLIFNQPINEVTTEMNELKALGIRAHHIPFGWKDIESTEAGCSQIVKALDTICKSERYSKRFLRSIVRLARIERVSFLGFF